MRVATFRNRNNGTAILSVAAPGGDFFAVPDLLSGPGGKYAGRAANLDLLLPRETRWLGNDGLEILRELAALGAQSGMAPVDMGEFAFAPPVLRPGKIIAVGRNYMDHVREGQEIWAKRGRSVAVPTFPSAFAKYASALIAHGEAITLPRDEGAIDYEIELAVIIGAPAFRVDTGNALNHVAAYTICNDVGARNIQRREMEAQIGITLAKNFPGFAPMGPWLVTADEIADPQRLSLQLEVDGEQRQNASTADMIFPVAELVSYWSRIGLETGDIIITGTPSGVALARSEPELFYLRDGQTVSATIEGIGTLENPVRMAP